MTRNSVEASKTRKRKVFNNSSASIVVGAFFSASYCFLAPNEAFAQCATSPPAPLTVSSGESCADAGVTRGSTVNGTHAIDVQSGGTYQGNNVNLFTTGEFARAINVSGTGQATLAGGSAVTQQQYSYGLSAESGGAIHATDFGIETNGYAASAALAEGAGSRLTLDTVNITTRGIAGKGLDAVGIGATISGSNLTIRTEGGPDGASGSYGAIARDGASIELENSRIDTFGDIATGLYALDGGQVRGTNVNIHTTGSDAYGLLAANSALLGSGLTN